MVTTAPLRIAFFGTPDFAVPSLATLIASRHEVVALVSQPDRPKGRGHRLQPTPTKQVVSDKSVPGQTWTHIACTYDGSTLRVVLEGEAHGDSSASVSATAATPRPTRIGGSYIGGSDEIRIYAEALSEETLCQHSGAQGCD